MTPIISLLLGPLTDTIGVKRTHEPPSTGVPRLLKQSASENAYGQSTRRVAEKPQFDMA